jgi:hypothetical protein
MEMGQSHFGSKASARRAEDCQVQGYLLMSARRVSIPTVIAPVTTCMAIKLKDWSPV